MRTLRNFGEKFFVFFIQLNLIFELVTFQSIIQRFLVQFLQLFNIITEVIIINWKAKVYMQFDIYLLWIAFSVFGSLNISEIGNSFFTCCWKRNKRNQNPKLHLWHLFKSYFNLLGSVKIKVKFSEFSTWYLYRCQTRSAILMNLFDRLLCSEWRVF